MLFALLVSGLVTIDYESLAKHQMQSLDEKVAVIESQLKTIRRLKTRIDRSLDQPRIDEEAGEIWIKSRTQRREQLKAIESALRDAKLTRWNKQFDSVNTIQIDELQVGLAGNVIHLHQAETIGPRRFSGGTAVGSASASAFVQRATSPMVRSDVWIEVLQVWAEGECLCQLWSGKKQHQLAVVLGLPENVRLDGEKAKLPPVGVLGKRSYQSPAGQRTVLELRVLNAENHLNALNAAIGKLREKRYGFRTWNAKSGGFSTEARMIGFDGKVVELQKKNGESVRVLLDLLSLDDRNYAVDVLGVPDG